MKQRISKVVLTGITIGTLAIALGGCGTLPSGPQPTATSSTPASNNLLSSPQQLQGINVKTTKGQNEINSQINKNLNNLDHSLNALANSMGQL